MHTLISDRVSKSHRRGLVCSRRRHLPRSAREQTVKEALVSDKQRNIYQPVQRLRLKFKTDINLNNIFKKNHMRPEQ